MCHDGTVLGWRSQVQGRGKIRVSVGHEAIWKLMQDEGIFQGLALHDRQAGLVRQIRCAMMGLC